MNAEFDQYETEYEQLISRSIRFLGRGHEFYIRAKADYLINLVREHVGDPTRQRALDVGCGAGITDQYLESLGELHGVDVSTAMIERARRTNPSVQYRVADARHLPFDADAFDVAFAITVLHHLDLDARQRCLEELVRVVRSGGITVIFEHNPLNPLTRLAVLRCQFDVDAVLLGRRETGRRMRSAGFDILDERYIVLTPWAGRLAQRLEHALGRLPLGAQYYVAGRA
jgi:ubiquinone/menaquinone biosynthesis C-methylase UbiE